MDGKDKGKLELKLKNVIVDSLLLGFTTYIVTGSVHSFYNSFGKGGPDMFDPVTDEWGIYAGLGVMTWNFIHELGHQIHDFYRGPRKKSRENFW